MKQIALVSAMMLLALVPSSALAKPTIILHDDGGVVVEYIKRYADLRDQGQRVIVDGPCMSACTLVLGILPPKDVCATPNATFGFHSATEHWINPENNMTYHQYAPEISRVMFDIYPGRVRKVLTGLGWNGLTPHPSIILVGGDKLSSIVRRCGAADFL